MSFYLAVDTATEACSVAVSLDGNCREIFEVVERGHTRMLLPMIRQLLADCGKSPAQLDGIACGVGPGSFSGVRIGVGLVKGLALAAELPVVGVSSLAMLAQQAIRQHQAEAVIPAIDARMNEIYLGAYRRDAAGRAEAVMPDRVCAASAAPRLPAANWAGAGSGWNVDPGALRSSLGAEISSVDAAALPHAQDALALALPEFAGGRGISADALAPAYLRDKVALTLAEQKRIVR